MDKVFKGGKAENFSIIFLENCKPSIFWQKKDFLTLNFTYVYKFDAKPMVFFALVSIWSFYGRVLTGMATWLKTSPLVSGSVEGDSKIGMVRFSRIATSDFLVKPPK